MQSFSLFKALCLCITAITFMTPFTSAAEFAGGTGEPNDPYQIATAEQLISIDSDPNLLDKHFVLINDIDLDPNLPGGRVFDRAIIAPCEGRKGPSRGEPEFPEGTTFTGSFNGSDYTINNFTLDSDRNDYMGLFGVINSTGHVVNLKISNAHLAAETASIGLLAGRSQGQIADCYANGEITYNSEVTYNGDLGGLVGDNEGLITRCLSRVSVIGTGSMLSLGGLVGNNGPNGSITYSCATGDVRALGSASSLGGLVGYNGGKIINCFATGAVTGGEQNRTIGGLVGCHMGCIVANCYSTGQVTGRDVLGNNSGLVGDGDSRSVYRCFWDIVSSGVSESVGGMGLTTEQMQDPNTFLNAGWDMVGERANGTADLWIMPEGGGYPELSVFSESYKPHLLEGTGTPEDPYQIATAKDLGAIPYYDQSACYEMVADINLAGITWSAAPIEYFVGIFDGNDSTLSNLAIRGEWYLGLFGSIGTNGIVRNLTITDSNIVGGYLSYYLGAIAGQNYGFITDCHASGRISAGDYCVFLGELVGSNSGTITRCSVAGSVSGSNGCIGIGGLTGDNWSIIDNSYS
jgi:hypothetical protein